ncbi:MAG: dihydrodipicolinate synthase family protein [Thermomicrobiales bacterium]
MCAQTAPAPDGRGLTPLTGVFPIAPTPFHDDESIDFDGQDRIIDYLIDAGVDGICILANYSEQ